MISDWGNILIKNLKSWIPNWYHPYLAVLRPMDQSEQPSFHGDLTHNSDPAFVQQVQRLHQLTIYGRWLFVGCLWLTIAPICLWNLKAEIALWQQYFTWVAVRYGLLYHPLSTFGLAFCIGMTTATLIWQSRNILIGLPQQEKQRLEKQVFRIRQQGPSHPLWKWVCQPLQKIKD